jgi:anti-sigma regulatory factor (Ser/Thr protein kinase)
VRTLEPVSLDLRLEARPELGARVRKCLRAWLQAQGATRDEIVEVQTAVSEAFANAVEHPCGRSLDRIDVEGWVVDQTVTLRVRDYGSWQPERLRPGGNGFLLMRGLMDAIEVDRWPDGTAITMRRQLSGC